MMAYLKKLEGSEEFYQIVDSLNASHIRYALTENSTIYVSLIKQFWETATARTLDIGEEYVVPQPRSPTQTHVADEATSTSVDVRYRGSATTVTGLEAGQCLTLQELTVLCTTLSKKVESLETDLKQTKLIYGAAYKLYLCVLCDYGIFVVLTEVADTNSVDGDDDRFVVLTEREIDGWNCVYDAYKVYAAWISDVTPTKIIHNGNALHYRVSVHGCVVFRMLHAVFLLSLTNVSWGGNDVNEDDGKRLICTTPKEENRLGRLDHGLTEF
ncbi:hypothetical protein Tco_0752223 [Tanacetum coccineum]|uniref:Uncharacterized protein n=1 Tax=Tanacetum coccineum TaxID=301880 RepID=A0ABQ4Z745_9ASTR